MMIMGPRRWKIRLVININPHNQSNLLVKNNSIIYKWHTNLSYPSTQSSYSRLIIWTKVSTEKSNDGYYGIRTAPINSIFSFTPFSLLPFFIFTTTDLFNDVERTCNINTTTLKLIYMKIESCLESPLSTWWDFTHSI